MSEGNTGEGTQRPDTLFCTHLSLLARLEEMERAGTLEPGAQEVCGHCGRRLTYAAVAMARLGLADQARHIRPEDDPDSERRWRRATPDSAAGRTPAR